MKKGVLAALLMLAFALPLLGLAEAASPKAHHGKKRHSHVRHHTRKSTAGPKRSHVGKRGHHRGTAAHGQARKTPPAERSPR